VRKTDGGVRARIRWWEIGNALESTVLRWWNWEGLRLRRWLRRVAGGGFGFVVFGHDCLCWWELGVNVGRRVVCELMCLCDWNDE